MEEELISPLEKLKICTNSSNSNACDKNDITAYLNDVSGTMVKKTDVLTAINNIVGGYKNLLEDYEKLQGELGKCNTSYVTEVDLRKKMIDEYQKNVSDFHTKCLKCTETIDLTKTTVKVNNLKALHMYSLIQKDKGRIKLFITIITVIFILLVLRFYHLI